MRYYKFSAADRKLVMAETELPEPGPGQVRVRVAAASLNYRDVAMISRFRRRRDRQSHPIVRRKWHGRRGWGWSDALPAWGPSRTAASFYFSKLFSQKFRAFAVTVSFAAWAFALQE
jgi:hypothetical protein